MMLDAAVVVEPAVAMTVRVLVVPRNVMHRQLLKRPEIDEGGWLVGDRQPIGFYAANRGHDTICMRYPTAGGAHDPPP